MRDEVGPRRVGGMGVKGRREEKSIACKCEVEGMVWGWRYGNGVGGMNMGWEVWVMG